ncbi:hypothetical protein [Leyella stercorea]|uniref:hypothetical protein n=1 Tax=Leyella stercorea TaxID=363265 RepID=UPI0026DCAB35|nr:hypothetical protein [Leyella stercorea]
MVAFTPSRNDGGKCLANFTLSSYKRAKTAETSANLPLGEIIQGRFAKHLRDFFRMTNRK